MVAGWRVWMGTTPVPNSMRSVAPAAKARPVRASKNGVCGTQIDAKPLASAATEKSRSASGVAQSAPVNKPICIWGVAIDRACQFGRVSTRPAAQLPG